MNTLFKNIVFDVDGTLIDSNLISLKTLQETIKTVEHRIIDIEELKLVLGLSDFDAFDVLNLENKKKCYIVWKKKSIALEDKKNIFPGILETLEKLKILNVNLGIVTSRETSHLYSNKYVKSILNLYFDTVITYESTHKHKPDPEPLLEWLRLSNSEPSLTLYIGDTKNDYICANKAKIKFGLAGWGLHQDFKTAIIFRKPNNILELFK